MKTFWGKKNSTCQRLCIFVAFLFLMGLKVHAELENVMSVDCGNEDLWSVQTSHDTTSSRYASCTGLGSVSLQWSGAQGANIVFAQLSVILDTLTIETKGSELGTVSFPKLVHVTRIKISSHGNKGISHITLGSSLAPSPLNIACHLSIQGEAPIASVSLPYAESVGMQDGDRLAVLNDKPVSDVCGSSRLPGTSYNYSERETTNNIVRGVLINMIGPLGGFTINSQVPDHCTDTPFLASVACEIGEVLVHAQGDIQAVALHRVTSIRGAVNISASQTGSIREVLLSGPNFEKDINSEVHTHSKGMISGPVHVNSVSILPNDNFGVDDTNTSTLNPFQTAKSSIGSLQILNSFSLERVLIEGGWVQAQIGHASFPTMLGEYQPCKGAGLFALGDDSATCSCVNSDDTFLDSEPFMCPERKGCETCVDLPDSDCVVEIDLTAKVGCCQPSDESSTQKAVFKGVQTVGLCLHFCEVEPLCRGTQWDPRSKSCTVYTTPVNLPDSERSGTCSHQWCYRVLRDDDNLISSTSSSLDSSTESVEPSSMPTATSGSIQSSTSTTHAGGSTALVGNVPEESSGDNKNSVDPLLILGAVVAVFVVLILLAALLVWRRYKKKAAARRRRKSSTASTTSVGGSPVSSFRGAKDHENRGHNSQGHVKPMPVSAINHHYNTYNGNNNSTSLQTSGNMHARPVVASSQGNPPLVPLRSRKASYLTPVSDHAGNRATVYEPIPDDVGDTRASVAQGQEYYVIPESALNSTTWTPVNPSKQQAIELQEDDTYGLGNDIYSEANFRSRHASYVPFNDDNSDVYEAPAPLGNTPPRSQQPRTAGLSPQNLFRHEQEHNPAFFSAKLSDVNSEGDSSHFGFSETSFSESGGMNSNEQRTYQLARAGHVQADKSNKNGSPKEKKKNKKGKEKAQKEKGKGKKKRQERMSPSPIPLSVSDTPYPQMQPEYAVFETHREFDRRSSSSSLSPPADHVYEYQPTHEF
eukprot:m.44195 g.44195  ORF g.44195 m.44195 type:complete len:984 (+) comp10067_c0_seq1:299-3250(+)